MAIWFHSKYPGFELSQKRKIKEWLSSIIASNGFSTGNINYIFSTDKEILTVNKDFLNHDFYTDIISFDYSDEKVISGDIYISIDRVKENAINYDQDFTHELRRVLIHGILNFLGYKDKTSLEAKAIRTAETDCLRILNLP